MKKLLFLFCINLVIYHASAQTVNSDQIQKADSLLRVKDYKNAATIYDYAYKNENNSDRLYNAACAWALAANVDNAFKDLDLIAGKDYFYYDQIVTDADLISLHTDKRWSPLINKIKKAKLTRLSATQLNQDFDLLVSSLKEAHTGLYWYNTKPQFDSICMAQKAKIKSGLTDLDLYNLIAPLVTFVKEGHCFIHPGFKTQAYLRFSCKYFPLYLKFLNNQPYIINNSPNAQTKGFILTKINGVLVSEIMQKFMSFEPADGYNTTSKYRWIEQNGKFSAYYARCFPQTDAFSIEVCNPETAEIINYSNIAPVSYNDFYTGYKTTVSAIPNAYGTVPAELKISNDTQTATLTINTFSAAKYRQANLKFADFVKDSFKQINQNNIKHLIIDIRKNGGGREGYEDYLLSYLINKDYLKYKYVQASAFSYSFYPFTDYKYDWKSLDNELMQEHYLEKDGRILRKPGIEEHEKPQPNPFKGDVYILVSGLTYSGGSEFASLAKNHTDAVFIGEEVGGGYYGNTSGITLTLKLPNSKIEVGIPILKFVVDTPKDKVPFGHGVMPDYSVMPTINQYLSGYDAELEFARQLIKAK